MIIDSSGWLSTLVSLLLIKSWDIHPFGRDGCGSRCRKLLEILLLHRIGSTLVMRWFSNRRLLGMESTRGIIGPHLFLRIPLLSLEHILAIWHSLGKVRQLIALGKYLRLF